ncbi:hypothetical protein F2P81_001992 [Scophthalmus maximus]|uniref:Cytohesin-2 n=1 Tax=Scophthalmus maximus TaxID=52904 RepID=A0A6A4THM1_SCOMX|nr:hypothetical protein F2P81_001992 [Scophthalmus maximus]
MRSPEPSSLSPAEALLHGQFASWGSGSNSNNNSCPNSPGGPGGLSPASSLTLAPASNYALTLTHTHIHIQRLSPRSGKEARLLLPLSELVGCSCPRAPAPPLLVLYWYPPGKRRKGVSRRRQVRAYLAESRPEAERWSAALQCLLRGVTVTADTEFSRSLLPRPRRLLLLVNPFSGRGQAMQWCQTHILPMIREANISYNLIQTERQNHARELIREISLPEWDGIVIVSGDGLLHEVINGLMERPDWELAIKIPVSILPCGSGNALAGSVNHHAGYDMCLREPLLLNCCFLLCRGGVRPMDLVSVTTSPAPSNNSRTAAPKRLFSFLSVAWGFVSDVDIESERYRGLGSARFTLGTLVRIASLRSYKGRLSYLPPSLVTTSPDTTPPLPRRSFSRSITEGLEGFCQTPIHRTCSDMGISEQRSLRMGEGEREKEERQRERERRRERARGGGSGVVRASSLAEDREREGQMEMEAEEERSGTSSESNERDGCNMGGEQRLPGIKDEREEEGRAEKDSSEMDDRGKDGESSGGSVVGEGVLHARELGESNRVDMGREADEDPEGCFTYQDSIQKGRQSLRKNSAPSSQIANTLFNQPLSQGEDADSGTSYGLEDVDLNGSYYQKEPYPLDVALDSEIFMPKSKAPKMDDLDYIPVDLSPEERSELEDIRRRKGVLLQEIQRLREELREAILEVEGLETSTEGSKTLQKSRHVAMGRKKFNMDPKKGIVFLVENELLRHTQEDIAQFLYKGEGLNKTAIGDYLGERDDFNIKVLQAFVDLHEFTDLNLVQALRQFLWSFRLPGEAQKIDRMMEAFAQRYCHCNPGVFQSTDTCYVLSFAIIMLNTSLHNPNVRDKPGLDRFISMNRGINEGGDLPEELLRNLYESIKNEPFKIPEDDGNDLTHTFFNPDREGWLLKLGGRVKTWKRRWFILTDNCLYYFEYTTDKEPRGIIPLENLSIREVEDPRKPNCFELYIPNNRGQLIKACKTEADGRVVEGNHMVYRISAPTPEEKDEWIHSIKSAVSVDPFYEMLAARKKRISLKKKEEQP